MMKTLAVLRRTKLWIFRQCYLLPLKILIMVLVTGCAAGGLFWLCLMASARPAASARFSPLATAPIAKEGSNARPIKAQPTPAQLQTNITLSLGPARMTAVVIEDDSSFSAEIELVMGKDKFEMQTGLPGNTFAEAVHCLRSGVGWKGRYLFVMHDSIGGNDWRVDVDNVFMVRKGRLRHVGDIRRPNEIPATLGAGYRDGWFYDRNVCLQYAMESHADGIFFAAVMKETNGHFQVDLERTWKLNRASFTWSPKAHGTKAKRISSNDADALASELHWFVENAALAKYCGRPNLQTILKDARSRLPPETFKELERLLKLVIRGQPPRSSWEEYDTKQWNKM